MPFILLSLIFAVGLFGNLLPLELKTFIYAISLAVKSLIIFILPWVILGLLFKVTAQTVQKASKLILLVLFGICISNFITSLVGGYIGHFIYHFDYEIAKPEAHTAGLTPMFTLKLPQIIANDVAMLLGLGLGFLLGKCYPKWAQKISRRYELIILKILSALKYTIPFFVVGFLVKLKHEGLVLSIIENYGLIFLTIGFVVIIYLVSLYFIVSRLDFRRLVRSIKNMLPACIVGFSTMSSAAAMPLMIEGAAKSSDNPEVVRSVVPMGVNFHLIGCSITIPILVFAILKNFGLAQPSLISYLIFVGYFVVAKFSVAAVPGGGIIVMLPIIESCFGFNADMLSLITALYILFDPIITSCNILGNGYFAIGIGNIFFRK